MATTFKPFEKNGRYGVHYILDKTGEGIRMHAHTERSQWHSIECLKGSITLYGDALNRVLQAGQELTFKSYRCHEIAALEDQSELVNWFIYGKPAEYEGIPLEQLSGCVAPVLIGKQYFGEQNEF